MTEPTVTCVLDAQARLGECPRWDADQQKLYWVDIKSKELHAFDPATGRDEKRSFDEEIGCFVLDQKGGFVAAMRSGFVRLTDFFAEPVAIVDPEADKPETHRFNDGRCDLQGRFLAGTMNELKSASDGTLYALEADGSWRVVAGDVLTSNGAAVSPDGKTLYYANTPQHVIHAYDYDPETGAASNKRVFHQFPFGNGRPDGASVDAEGCYWTALYDGARVVRLSPEGEILTEIAIPAQHTTMIAFGGEDLKTAYVTTARDNTDTEKFPQAGGIFSFRVDVPGLPETRFAG